MMRNIRYIIIFFLVPIIFIAAFQFINRKINRKLEEIFSKTYNNNLNHYSKYAAHLNKCRISGDLKSRDYANISWMLTDLFKEKLRDINDQAWKELPITGKIELVVFNNETKFDKSLALGEAEFREYGRDIIHMNDIFSTCGAGKNL